MTIGQRRKPAIRSKRYLNVDVNAEVVLAFTLHFVLFSLAILIVYIRGYVWGKGEPYNSIMPAPVTRFGDFFGVYDIWRTNEGFGGIGYGASYFPGLYIFVEILYLLTKDIWFALKLLCFFYIFVVSVTVMLFLRPRGLATSLMGLTMVLISYPSLIAFHTGNFEMLIFVLLLLGAVAAQFEKWHVFAFLIGVATSAKIFPGIFVLAPFVLTSSRVAIQTFLLAVRTSITFTLFALFFLPGGLSNNGIGNLIKSISESQSMYKDLMVTGVPGLHFGHSLLNGIHAVLGMDFLSSEIWAYPIMAVGVLWTIYALLFIRKLQPPNWIVFGFLGCSGCIFAPTSTDYKLLYLLPAIVLYFRDTEKKTKPLTLISLLVLAISPKPYWYVGEDAWTNANVWLTPILLIAFQFGTVIYLRFATSALTEFKNKSTSLP
jgi:hypothetical protein